MSDATLHELHADVYAPLHGRRCSSCRVSDACDRGISLDHTGEVGRADDPSAVVRWPKCPGAYLAEYRHAGQDLTSIGDILSWAYEQGIHRSRLLGAGGHRLLREWHRCDTFLPKLIELRSLERRRKMDGAR